MGSPILRAFHFRIEEFRQLEREARSEGAEAKPLELP